MEMEAAAILCQRSIKEGTGLRSKVKERRCKAVSIGGETVGSLKETAIVKLTNFYRNAIKDNCNDVEKMKRAIYATLYHCSSTDAKPKHNKCTNAKRSWCFFKRAFANGKSSENHSVMKTKLTEEVVAKILLVYQRLASNEILSRCTSESHWEHQDSSLVTMDFKKLGSFSPSVQLSLLIAFSSEDKVCGTDSAHIFVLPKHSCKDESQEPADFRQENAQTFDLAWFDCTATMSADSGAPNDKTGYMSDIMCAEILTTRGRCEEESISTELRRFWEIESLGILDKGSVTLGNGDEEILSEFDKSVNFVDGRYRVNLPWKPGMREALQNNKTVARKRFEGLVRRFICDHELFCEYKDVIDDYVREGIVGRTSCDSLLDSQGFYLPHHAVIRSDKTTSHIKIVFDGSAHEDGQSSLNQSLYTGPNLHPNILELLLCFRKSPVAFTADVKSAFLQIELDFRDRDFTRFFWTDNLNNETYVLNFTRVLFGLRPIPCLLAATLNHHFKKYGEQYPHTFDMLNSSIYVDDLICCQNDVPDALRTTLECLKIFSDAGMLLRKWRSNSKQLNLLWQQEGVKTESSETSAIDLRSPSKVLGLAWDPENDLIYFDPRNLLKFMSHRGESKRFILSVVGRILDPIGILGPFVIKLKCLLQELWTLGVEWDSELPPKLRHKWQQWSSEAEGLSEIKIPRFYLGNIDQEISKCEIHCFSDASKSAYGTILYLRFVTCNNEIETSFICSKSRVAPLKSLTLPRLELTAALLSARLAKQVSSCLKFDANIYYWTDSLISYYWIRGDSSAFKPYIKNRVQEI
ncbi:integrase catalytic domain-containing protein [Trichonephila clavipes]|nr:integrase catalytic domain-containing protein [Trichonephila clavipes]